MSDSSWGEVFQQLFNVPFPAAMKLHEPLSPGNLLLELFTYHGCAGFRNNLSGPSMVAEGVRKCHRCSVLRLV